MSAINFSHKDDSKMKTEENCPACSGIKGAAHTCGIANTACAMCGHDHNVDGSCEVDGCACSS